MPTADRLTAEREAVESLMKLFQQAEECRTLHERARMTLPEPLKRLIGLNGATGVLNGGHQRTDPLQIPAPDLNPTPSAAGRDWVRISLRDASPTSIVLAILRGEKEPMRAGEVVDAVLKILPEVPAGSVSNIGTRLQGKLIDRTENGWTLIDESSAGIIQGEWLWAPVAKLSKQELAAHRRDAIVHLLGYFDAGLELVQILEQLLNCRWVQAPINKDLLKPDLVELQKDGKIRRRGKTRKWELVRD